MCIQNKLRYELSPSNRPFNNFDEPRAASPDVNLSGNFATSADFTPSAEALKEAEANIDTLPVTTAKPNAYEELPKRPPQYEDLSGIQNPLFTMDATEDDYTPMDPDPLLSTSLAADDESSFI